MIFERSFKWEQSIEEKIAMYQERMNRVIERYKIAERDLYRLEHNRENLSSSDLISGRRELDEDEFNKQIEKQNQTLSKVRDHAIFSEALNSLETQRERHQNMRDNDHFNRWCC
jgi:hypothetical protein